ncbi:MAG TPA: hypothetical protein DCP28_09860, partial [Cytophagales bacterium]|nr:hypothetical protein [Cytophagales bacterium]
DWPDYALPGALVFDTLIQPSYMTDFWQVTSGVSLGGMTGTTEGEGLADQQSLGIRYHVQKGRYWLGSG